MDLLTNRLVMITSQITANHMAVLREKESLELKRVTDYKRAMRTIREKNLYNFRETAAESQIRKTKFGNAVCLNRNSLQRTKNEEKKENTKQDKQKSDEDTAKEITTAGRIWGIYNKNHDNESKIDESKESSAPKPKLNKFRRAARTTVLIETLKGGHSICTCENLNAHCKVHDSNSNNSDGNESNESSDGDSVENSPLKTSKLQNAARTTVLVKNCTCEDPDANGPCRVHGCYLNDFYINL